MQDMKWISNKFGNLIMSVWTLTTTTLYTIVLGIPTILVALLSRTGRAPFALGCAWSWLILKTNRVKVRVVGLEKIAIRRSYVFISNHASHLDPPAVALALKKPLRFIGKKSLSKIPIFGWAAQLARMIFIDRSDSIKAIETINTAVKELKDGVSAYFFAEGTRSADGFLQAFKKGGVMLALKAKLPIIPITIIGSHALLPKHGRRIRPGEIKVIVGDPIDTAGYSESDKDLLLQKIRGVIAETLQRSQGQYPSDCRLLAARQA